MLRLTIDGKSVEVEQGTTILDAARKIGISIPTLCFREGYSPSTSCMVCIVKVKNRIIPSCATVAEDGMEIESETDEIHEARRTALELLLSDHTGDCIAPCHNICPAGMNIPLMIRQIAEGDLRSAIITVKGDIPLPAVLGRICPAPCEKGCRRGSYDSPLSICLLKRYVADVDLASEHIYLQSCESANGKRIAIVGAGPAGLSATYYLLQKGYACTIYDDHDKPGGALQYAVPEDKLPHTVLDAEIGIIQKLGAEFRLNTKIGEDIKNLQTDYDAVLIATGQNENPFLKSIKADRNTLQSNVEGIFVAGNALGRKSNLAVRSIADGKLAANSIDQYLSSQTITGYKPFTTRMGKLTDVELQHFVANASKDQRVEPSGNNGFSEKEAYMESLRCLHCDCRKADNCKLRNHSDIYGADLNKYKGERRLFEQQYHHEIIYESGKCISCGLCIQIASRAREALGLAFIGRGFNVKVGVPFSRTIEEGLQKVAIECVEACPTGALVFKDGSGRR
jgi:ferredoxin